MNPFSFTRAVDQASALAAGAGGGRYIAGGTTLVDLMREGDEGTSRPFSSRSMRECLRLGAERFGWQRRRVQPGTLRDGHWRIGLGMATTTYRMIRNPASARVRLQADGTAIVETAASDMGPGTYTSLTQIACETLELPPEKVRVAIGDSRFPRAPPHGGSQTLASVGSAVLAACRSARAKFAERQASAHPRPADHPREAAVAPSAAARGAVARRMRSPMVA